jgi:hypothetical protein
MASSSAKFCSKTRALYRSRSPITPALPQQNPWLKFCSKTRALYLEIGLAQSSMRHSMWNVHLTTWRRRCSWEGAVQGCIWVVQPQAGLESPSHSPTSLVRPSVLRLASRKQHSDYMSKTTRTKSRILELEFYMSRTRTRTRSN